MYVKGSAEMANNLKSDQIGPAGEGLSGCDNLNYSTAALIRKAKNRL